MVPVECRVSALVGVVIAVLVIAGAFTPLSHSMSDPVASASSLVDSSGYTYSPYSATFGSFDTPTALGPDTGVIDTDWGSIRFKSTSFPGSTVNALYFGDSYVGGGLGFYDTYLSYWYYNGTSKAGRPFGTYWGNYSLINSDAYSYSIQCSAEAPHAYSGTTKEWNLTVRYTVLLNDPIVKIDYWLRWLNASSLIDTINLQPLIYIPSSWDGMTKGFDDDYALSYRYANDGTWALGALTAGGVSEGGNSAFSCYPYQVNRSTHHLDQTWFGSTVWMLGYDLDDLRDRALEINSCWLDRYESTDYNLVYAKNGEIFDCIEYFHTLEYTIVPSGTSEVVYSSGAEETLSFVANPIRNYEKVPVVSWVDDNSQGYLEMVYASGEHWDWMHNQTRSIGTAMTFGSDFSTGTPYRFSDWSNWTDLRNGTQYEIADHGYDHGNHYTPLANQNYDWQYDNWTQSASAFSAYGVLESMALPYNAYSYNTLDAKGSAGCNNLRLEYSSNEWVVPQDYNESIPASSIFVSCFTSLFVSDDADAGYVTQSKMFGYQQLMGHYVDFDTGPERATVLAWWSWLANQTELLSVTMSQWSDLWHHRIGYFESSGVGHVDLMNCSTDHRIYLGLADGTAPLVMDIGDGSLVSGDFVGGESVVDLEAGHIYQILPVRVVSDGETAFSFVEWDPATYRTGSVMLSLILSGDDLSVSVSGLRQDVGYKVLSDGDEILRQHQGVSGTVSFTVSGYSELNVVVWDPYALWDTMASLMLPIGMCVGIAAILMALLRRGAGRG